MKIESGKISSQGQVTIPKGIRDILKVGEGDRLEFISENGMVLVKPIKSKKIRDILSGGIRVDKLIPIDEARETYQKEIAKEWSAEEKVNFGE